MPTHATPTTRTSEMTMDAVITELLDAGAQLAVARVRVMELADQRALVKSEAIDRLVETKVATSLTAAEKVVEKDAAYLAHRRMEYDAVRDECMAWARWEASKVRAGVVSGVGENGPSRPRY